MPLPSVKCRFLARAQEDSLSRTFVNPLASLGICERLYTIRKEKARCTKAEKSDCVDIPELRSTSLPYKVRKESSARKKKARDVNTCQHHIATSKSPSRCTSLGPHGKKHIAERYRKKIDGRKNSLRLKLSFFFLDGLLGNQVKDVQDRYIQAVRCCFTFAKRDGTGHSGRNNA